MLATLVGRSAADKAMRTDPWFAYEDGQAWRLPAAMASAAGQLRGALMVRSRLVLPLAVTAALVIVGVGGAVTVSGQFRASVDVVRIEALVADSGGRPIAGLTVADFRLTDNGAAQTLTRPRR